MNRIGPAPIQVPIQGNASIEWVRWFASVQVLINKTRELPVYANNAAAIAGGLSVGDFYRTGGDPDAVCVVH